MRSKYPHRNLKCMDCGKVFRVSELAEAPSKDIPGGKIKICPHCDSNGQRMASPTGEPILKETLWHYAYRNLENTSH